MSVKANEGYFVRIIDGNLVRDESDTINNYV